MNNKDTITLRTPSKRLDLNDDLQIEIKANIFKGLTTFFNSPPNIEEFKKLFSTKSETLKNFKEIVGSFQFNKFNADDEHINLLNSIDYKKLNDKEKFQFPFLMYLIYEKRNEFSLAMSSVEKAIIMAKKLNNNEFILNSMIAKGRLFIKLEHPEVEKYHKEIIKFSKENNVDKGLYRDYHNWGTYYLHQTKISEALLLYEKEIPLLEKDTPFNLANHYGYLGEIYELIDSKEAISNYEKVILILEKEEVNNFNKISISEAYYRIARIKLILNEDFKVILELVLKSKDLLEQVDGYESRLAWNYSLIAFCYEKLNKKKISKEYESKKQRLLKYFGNDKELFRNMLSKYLNDINSKNTDEIKSLENIAINSANKELLLYWALVYSSHLLKEKKYDNCNNSCNYIFRLFEKEKNLLKKIEVKEGLSTLHDINSLSLSELKRDDESLIELENAVNLNPANNKLRWKFCFNCLKLKRFNKAFEHSEILINQKYIKPGPYRVMSYIEFSRNNIDKSISILMESRKIFPDHKEIKSELEELGDLKRGILEISDAKYFKNFYNAEESFISDLPTKKLSLPEFLELPSFHKDLIEKIPNFIYQLQKTPPSFIKVAKKYEFKNIEEGDFRDELERNLSFTYNNIAAEVKHGSGLSDLIIHPQNNSIDAVIFEFKIWNRNDFKSVVNQALKYLTDFQFCAVIFMVNLNKGSIDKKYIEEIIFQDSSYIIGSFREKPINFTANNFSHFYSEHSINNDKRYKIFHFIYNPN